MKSELNQAREGMYNAQAKLQYLIEVLGDELAKRNGYSVHGLEAIWVYLINKHHWLPRDVRTMGYEDLRLALHLEMDQMKAPKDAV